ncbi:unnamed protein product [Urochloa humidicola]
MSWPLLAAAFSVAIALADLSFDSWHSRLVRSGREIRMQGWLPALVPIRRASPCRAALGDAAGCCSIEENRSENEVTHDLFAMELKPEMTSKDV